MVLQEVGNCVGIDPVIIFANEFVEGNCQEPQVMAHVTPTSKRSKQRKGEKRLP